MKAPMSNKLQLMQKAVRARSLQQARLAIAYTEMRWLLDLMEMLTLLVQQGVAASLKAFLNAHKKAPLIHAENETQVPQLTSWCRRIFKQAIWELHPFLEISMGIYCGHLLNV